MNDEIVDEKAAELRMLCDSVNRFLKSEPALARVRKCRGQLPGHSRDVWQKMAEQGWLGLAVPDALGGMGLGLTELAVLAEKLGRGRAPEPFVAVAALAAVAIAGGDNTALQAELLEPLVAGKLQAALAWQEQPDTADPAQAEASAEMAEHGGWALQGQKILVVPAEADGFVVSAREREGLSLFWVPREAPGMKLTPRLMTDGSHSLELTLDHVEIPPEHQLASPAVGREVLERALVHGTIAASAELLGLMDWLLQTTVEYLGTRTQFNRPIGSFQVLQHRTIDLYIQRELCRAALYRATAYLDDDVPLAEQQLTASRIKARAGDAALVIAREAVQMHGAIGYTDEIDVGLYLHRILVQGAWLGNARWHRLRYSRLRSPIDREESL